MTHLHIKEQIMYLFSLCLGEDPLKRMVKAAGFEARIVQLRVRNLNASANYFRVTQSLINLI